MGAAVVCLPDSAPGRCSRRCLLILGGERCEEAGSFQHPLPRVRQLDSVEAYDLQQNVWCSDAFVPPMAEARTTMALCQGIGHVALAQQVNGQGEAVGSSDSVAADSARGDVEAVARAGEPPNSMSGEQS